MTQTEVNVEATTAHIRARVEIRNHANGHVLKTLDIDASDLATPDIKRAAEAAALGRLGGHG